MILLLFEIISASIAVSLIAAWMKLIPRYRSRKIAFVMNLINTSILTVVWTIFFLLDITPSWLILAILVFVVLVISIRAVHYLYPLGEQSDTSG
jgi:hypothetical protein